MAIQTNPLHEPTRSSRTLGAEQASPLLGRKVTLCYRAQGGSPNSVTTNLRDIYERFKKSLSESFRLTDFSIKGSCVTHLFSGEPFGDIDFHATIDLTWIADPKMRFVEGKRVNLTLLETIAKIISEKLPSATAASAGLIRTEDVQFDEKHIPFSKWGNPFNIHQLLLPGSIPLEFTISAVTGKVDKPVRDYDFNSGSLKLCIEGGQVKIHSNTKDVYATLEELKKRQIYCDTPGDIQNKGPERYFGKLIKSGYFDPKKKLLAELIKYAESRKKQEVLDRKARGSATPPSIAQDIAKYFSQKGIHPSAPFLLLWLLPNIKSECDIVKDLVTEASEILKSSFTSEANPEQLVLHSLVQDNKNKAECCWYLFMHAKSLRKVVHREEASLQLEIPSYPLFATEPSDASVFIIVPISGLKKLKSTSIAKGFLGIQRDGKPVIEVNGAKATDVIETKFVIQELCRSVLTHTDLYPILSAAMCRFGLESESGFSRLFIEWVLGLSEAEIEEIPLQTLLQAFKGMQEYEIDGIRELLESKPRIIFCLLKRLHKLVGKEKICSFEPIHLQTIVTCLAFLVLKKKAMWIEASEEDLQVMIDFGKQHIDKLCQKEKIQEYKERGLENFWKRILSFSNILYTQKILGPSEMVTAGKYCLELGCERESFRHLQIIIDTEDSLDDREIQAFFEALAEASPFEYVKFLKNNAIVIKSKITSFTPIIETFLEKLLTQELSPDLIALFLQLLARYCEEEDKKKITKTLFRNAAKGNIQANLLFEELAKQRPLSGKDFDWVAEMGADELKLFSEQSGFTHLLATDLDFTTAFIDQAILVRNFDLIIIPLMRLANSHPEKCLDYIESLNRCRIDSADLTRLPVTIKILAQLLDSHREFIINPRCRSLIELALTYLSIYFSPAEGVPTKVLNEQFYSSLQAFHKQVGLYTLENSNWPKIWRGLHNLPGIKSIKDWVKTEDLVKSSIGNILNFIDSFDVDGSFPYEFMQQVRNLPKDSHPDFAPVILRLLTKVCHSFFINPPNESTSEVEEVVSFVDCFRRYVDLRDLPGACKSLMSIYSFCAAYGGKEKQVSLLKALDKMHNLPSYRAHLEGMTEPQKILFLCTKRALKIRDLSLLFEIQRFYTAWGRNKTVDTYCSPDALHFLCSEWNSFLQEVFLDESVNKTYLPGSPELNAIGFYSAFLADTLRKPAPDPGSVLKSAKSKIIRGKLAHAIAFIDFLTEKKLIKSTFCLSSLSEVLKNLGTEQLMMLSPHCISMATNILLEMQKGPIKEEDLENLTYLLNFIGNVVSSDPSICRAEAYGVGIGELLEASWIVFSHFKGDEDLLQGPFESILFLQGTFSSFDMQAHHLSWAKSILSRKETVLPGEVSGWLTLTVRLDPRTSTESADGVYAQNFMDKLIVTEEYFNEPKVVEVFLGMINLGFNRGMFKQAGRPLDEGVFDMLHIDAFDFVEGYSPYIHAGIGMIEESKLSIIKSTGKKNILGKISDVLVEGHFDTLIRYLQLPKARCKLGILSFVLKSMCDGTHLEGSVYKDGGILKIKECLESKAGKLAGKGCYMGFTAGTYLSNTKRLPEAKAIEFLYLIFWNLSLVEEIEYESLSDLPEALGIIVKNDRRKIERHLSPDQINFMESEIRRLTIIKAAQSRGSSLKG